MPFVLSERLPVPTLKTYTIASITLFVISMLYAQGTFTVTANNTWSFLAIINGNNVVVWVVFNMIYCLVVLLGKIIQIALLGTLRETEVQNAQDFFWNFVFYKLIFIFGVYNAQMMSDIMGWITWFSMLGFLHLFGQLCKDRYDYLTSKPSVSKHHHVKLMALISSTYLLSYGLLVPAVYYGLPEGINIFAFMIAECILLNLKCFKVLLRYIRYFMESSHHVASEYNLQFDYYSELILDLLLRTTDVIYHIHMLIWSNGFLSLASLVLYWNIRTIFQEIKQCLAKHKLRKRIYKAVTERFRSASDEELSADQNHCVICWETLKSARILPCGHPFHRTCLCSWLQQDMSCPTCRMSLTSAIGIETSRMDERENISEFLGQRRNQGNSLFHFNGGQIASWLPTFSIEFFHFNADDNASDQELEEMAERLYSTFPSVPREEIWRDLRRTRSVEETADNVISRNLLTATDSIDFEDTDSSEDDEEDPDELSANEMNQEDFSDSSEMELSEQPQIFQEDSEEREKAFTLRKRKFFKEAKRIFLEKQADEESPLEAATVQEIADLQHSSSLEPT